MSNEENKVNFDLSTLNLSELIKVNENITNFIEFLNDKKIVTEVEVEDQDE